MSRLRDRRDDLSQDPEYRRLRRKADKEWDMAGSARKDGDIPASVEHTEKARQYESEARQRLEK